jgi:hypothetical protein
MAGNDLNFLADLLPSAIVKVVTVETLGGQLELERNPHIVEENVPVFKRAELQNALGVEGGARFEQLLTSVGLGLDAATGDQLASAGTAMGFKTSNKETTAVTLDCAVRDTLAADDVASQWFMSQDITKYLYITVTQFTSKRSVNAYKKLLKGAPPAAMTAAFNYLSGVISKDQLLETKPPVPGAGNIVKLKNDVSIKYSSVQDIVNSIDSSTTGNAISEQDLMLAGFASIDTNGNTVYDFPIKFQFEVKSATPSHLSYYVCTLLNIEQLLEDNNLNTTSVNMNASQYSMNGEWLTTIEAGELNLGDTRISDFRDVDDVVPAYTIDLSQVNVLNRLASGAGQHFTTLPAYRHKYFSDVHLSTDSSRGCGYLFGYSHLDFMKDMSVYGRFFDNVEDRLRDTVLRRCTIEEIKILRRRVKHHKQGAYARGFPNVYEPWNSEQVDHVVVSSKANRTGKVPPTQRVTVADTGERKGQKGGGGIREVELSHGDSNGKDFRIRHFTGKDVGVKDRTVGIYQYGVEITVRDYVPVYIGRRLQRLQKQVARLREYEVFANIPVVNRYKMTYTDPHVGTKFVTPDGQQAKPTVAIVAGESRSNTNTRNQTQVGHYDPTTNKFTREFLVFATSKYGRTRPWDAAPRAFVELMDLVVSEKMTRQKKEKMRKNLSSICNPRSGTPRGISAVIDTLEKYIKLVQDLISAEPPASNSSAASNPSTPNGGSGVTNRTITYKTYFANDAFNSDLPPFTGASFLGMSSAGGPASLGLVSTSDYISRASEEITKYFTSLTAIPSATSAYRCLSARSMNVLGPENTINLQTVRNRYKNSDGTNGPDRAAMVEALRSLVQYVGSKRKADDVNVLTVDSKQRLGQALAPEFGVTLMTKEEVIRELTYADSDPTRLTISPDADRGGTGMSFGSLSPLLPTPIEEEDEIDFADVFPSAMASPEWGDEADTSDIIAALQNITAGYETEQETHFLLQLLTTTKRDYLHSTKKKPADPNAPNFSAMAIVWFMLEESAKMGAGSWEAIFNHFAGMLNKLPPSIQAAAVSAMNGDTVLENIKTRMDQAHWDDPFYNLLYQLYFMMNVRVEFLAGYRTSNLQPKYEKSIGSEIWLPLEKSAVTTLNRRKGTQILCRLRPYNNEAMRISFPKAMDLPIWNAKFILVGNDGAPLAGMKRRIGLTTPATQIVREGLHTD